MVEKSELCLETRVFADVNGDSHLLVDQVMCTCMHGHLQLLLAVLVCNNKIKCVREWDLAIWVDI